MEGKCRPLEVSDKVYWRRNIVGVRNVHMSSCEGIFLHESASGVLWLRGRGQVAHGVHTQGVVFARRDYGGISDKPTKLAR